MTPDELRSHIAEMINVEDGILVQKNHDYSGCQTNALKNFNLVEELGICDTETGILVRMCDKVARLSNLLKSPPAVAQESIHDTIHDLRNYAAILDASLSEKEMAAGNSSVYGVERQEVIDEQE